MLVKIFVGMLEISFQTKREIHVCLFFSIERLLQHHPELLSDIIEQSNDEQRRELTRIVNSKTIN
jgi:hypothetical protein